MKETSKHERFWIGNLIIVTFFWGTTFVLVKAGLRDISVSWFLFYRFIITFVLSLFIVIIVAGTRNRKCLTKSNFISVIKSKGIFLGFVLYISYFFQTFGLQITSPSNAAFITSLSVIIVPAMLVLTGRKLSKIEIGANLVATLGLALLTINFTNLSVNLGDFIILGTSVSIAIHIFLTDLYVKKESALILTLSQFLSMAILSFITAIALEPSRFISIQVFSETTWIALLVTVIFATIYAFGVQTLAQKDNIKPSKIAIIFAFEPIFALSYSLYVGEEHLEILRLLGMILILIATFLVILKKTEIMIEGTHHLTEL